MTETEPTAATPAAPQNQPTAATQAPQAQSVGTVLRRLGPAGPLALIAATLPALGGFVLLAMVSPVAHWLRGHQELGVALYVLGFAAFSGAALLPTYAQAVVGGWAFGFGVGLAAALAGFFGGGVVGYFIGRWSAGDRALRLIQEHPKWAAVHHALLGSGFWRTLGIITLVRLNSPFALINYFFGATRTNLAAYVLGTVFGLAPRTAAAVWIATGIKELVGKPASPRWLIIASIVVAFVIVLVIGKIGSDAVAHVTSRNPAKPAA